MPAGCLGSGQYVEAMLIVALSLMNFFPTFYVPRVLLAFFYLKCTGSMKSLVSAKLEIGNVFNKSAFLKLFFKGTCL